MMTERLSNQKLPHPLFSHQRHIKHFHARNPKTNYPLLTCELFRIILGIPNIKFQPHVVAKSKQPNSSANIIKPQASQSYAVNILLKNTLVQRHTSHFVAKSKQLHTPHSTLHSLFSALSTPPLLLTACALFHIITGIPNLTLPYAHCRQKHTTKLFRKHHQSVSVAILCGKHSPKKYFCVAPHFAIGSFFPRRRSVELA